jgi:murein DD-endopeptidase MepM/ murein hydrolase activator NlpD
MRLTLALTAAFLVARSLDAQSARASLTPTRPAPGAIVRIEVRDSTSAGSITRVHGTMAGEPLHFTTAGEGRWSAIGPVPVDASGSVRARIVVERDSAADTLTASAQVPPVRVATSRLRVDSSFSRPLDSATAARVADENRRAVEVARRAHDTPRQWTRQFLRPRTSVVTSAFGSGRVFNGQVTSRHLGVDFRGGVGDTIRAANRGIVALVDEFFLAGNVVYIDHGEGVVTGYFHLSKPLVTPGDTVERGQKIGLVGGTGRVTGPHLHWSARYGAVTVNPLDLIRVTATDQPSTSTR